MLILPMLLSCAHVISKEARQGALTDVSLKSVTADIEKYKGQTFIFGGFIVKTKSTDEGTWMEIVQNPTNRYGHIVDTDESEGRFLILYKGHLDTLIYEKGRLITVAGTLTGTKEASIDDMKYIYPVFEVKEIYLWKEDVLYSAYPSYYPSYWDPWPWWRYPYFYPFP